MSGPRWICDECGEPIEPGHGTIDIYCIVERTSPTTGASYIEKSRPRRGSKTEIDVVHGCCDPRPDEEGYWIRVGDAHTAGGLASLAAAAKRKGLGRAAGDACVDQPLV